MFAPPVAKPKPKSAPSSNNKLTLQRSAVVGKRSGNDPVEQAHLLQRSIGNQAMSRLLARRASVSQNEPGAQEKNPGAARTAAQEAAPSWDFSTIPVFSPGHEQTLSIAPRLPIQAKLKVGTVNDPMEHEADRVADQVMRMPAPEVSAAAAPPQVSRKCAECEEEEKLQKKEAGTSEATGEAPPSVHEVLRLPGQPLDAETRNFMEPRFGQDFSGVRVHTDAAAGQSTRDVDADAYTVGRDIVFGVGQFAPATPGGRRLLAHELTHVVQQSAGNRAVATVVQRQAGAEGAYKIISQIWQVAGRDIVVVATGHGDQVLFFYRRIGLGSKGAGVAPNAGQWAPFKTLMAQDESILGSKANPERAWINKQPYYSQVAPEDPLRGMANKRNQQVGAWLDKQDVPAGKVKDWQTVEQEMDKVAGKYRQSLKGGGGGGGGGAKAATEATAAEVKGGAVEAKAAGVEAKALATEAKLVGAEATALKAENVLSKGAQIAAKGAKLARISELVIALGMPGPQDVFFMFIAAFASIAEAKAKLRADAYALGFAEGLAAVITWTSADDAQRMLMYTVANPSIGERVAGFEAVREKGTNEGVAAGWKFGNALNGAQRKGFRALALAATGLRERRHSSRDDLIRLGVALRPTVIELLEEAERQERQKRLAEEWRLANLRPPM